MPTTELATLLFGGPFPAPACRPADDAFGCGKRSDVYGKAVDNAMKAASKLVRFTATDVALVTNMNRATANRALIKLMAKGKVRKAVHQTGGAERSPAVWELVI